MIQLNEWRGLRDAYGNKAASALARRFHAKSTKTFLKLIDEAKIVPTGILDTLRLYAETTYDMTDWAAITRFCWLAEAVWEIECDELAEQCCPSWKHEKRNAA